jgi:hypothetical protein
MTLVETKTLASAAAWIEFASIPQDATDLLVVVSARASSGGLADGVAIRFNVVGTGYTARRLYGYNSSVASDDNATGDFIINGPTSTSDTFSNTQFYIPNYAGSINKSYSNEGVAETNATNVFIGMTAGQWSNTAAITSLRLSAESTSNLVIGSMASLYKITKGSSGGVVVS